VFASAVDVASAFVDALNEGDADTAAALCGEDAMEYADRYAWLHFEIKEDWEIGC
jgi:hypothetical protein